MNRNTYLSSQYSVPSLSLSSSRSKRTVPTKDTTQLIRPVEHKIRTEIMDRINRPPIFSSKNIGDSKISIQSSSSRVLQHQKSSQSIGVNQGVNLNRNVYLQQVQRQVQKNQSTVTFRATNHPQTLPPKPPTTTTTTNYLRNPQSHQIATHQIQRRLQQKHQKKIDVNKSLFDRRIKKLLQEAQFYDSQLMGMYADNSQVLNKELMELEKCRKDALSFNFGSTLLI